jgi:antitoxin component YwqK of YwqJK toxin-antitoxin module
MAEIEIQDLIVSRTIKVDYKGQTENGKPHGWGKAYSRDGSMYDGEWKDGLMDGKGQEFYPDGTLQYDGYYKDGFRHGRGKSYFKNGKLGFDGEWVRGQKVGGPKTTTNWA